jgi:beta-fructofuranosidase
VLLPAAGWLTLAFEFGAAGERAELSFDCARGALALDRSAASLDRTTLRTRCTAPLPLAAGEPLDLRIFLDRSVVEVFANGRCLTTRLYPTDISALNLRASATPSAHLEGRSYLF